MAEPLLEVRGLRTHFPILSKVLRRRVGTVRAVDGVDLTVMPGEVLGIVGESGSGKTTAGKSILRLIEPTAGSIAFEGREITGLSAAAMLPLRRRMQIVFQDPMSSLNPRMTVGRILAAHLKSTAWRAVPRRAGMWPICCAWWACRRRRPGAIRTNSPAGSASAWASPGRWRCVRR